MRSLSFLAIVIIAGLIAGLIHGIVNVLIVEPYLDDAIGIENQRMFASGNAKDTPEFWQKFVDYRIWQKQGSVIAGAMLGVATGALFGVVFAYSRHVLPTQNEILKALVLAGIMWAAIFFIPFLKYPSNPPTVGDPNTILFRTLLYVGFVGLSGFGALVFSKVYKNLPSKKYLAFLGYAGFISTMFIIFPQNPDKITVSTDLVNGFRLVSVITMLVYWISNATILGWLWKKVKPHIDTPQVFE